jgi:hypothetical protein
MKKIILLIIVVATFFGCSKQSDNTPAAYAIEMSSQTIFAQNIATLQLISNSVLNSAPFSFEANDISLLSNKIDEKIKESYPLAFSYPSLTKTKSSEESISSLIPSNYIDELKHSILFDIDKFNAIKAHYFQSEYFLCLGNMEQEDVNNYLNTVELCRNTVLETAFEITNRAVTKVSGAEMRGWSEMAQQMPEEEQQKVVDAFFFVAAGVAEGTTGWILAAVGLLVSWLR